MLNPTAVLIDAFVAQLKAAYDRMYGGQKPHLSDITAWAGRMALENIANGDALYHNVEHTIFVTEVGQAILNGRHTKRGGVSCDDWLHVSIALLCHDIGFVKGVCKDDDPANNRYATGTGDMVELPPGASDAALSPHHITRGQQFIVERFSGHDLISAERIKTFIADTQFPVPADDPSPDTSTYGALVRSADLIGQLGDPRYLQKLHALFYEFEEIGANARMGFKTTHDLRANYPSFYWNSVHPHVQAALAYLDVTQNGKAILANLYANIFRREHSEGFGPV